MVLVSGHGGVPHVGEVMAIAAETVINPEPVRPSGAVHVMSEVPADTPVESPEEAVIVATLGVALDQTQIGGTLVDPSVRIVIAVNWKVAPMATVGAGTVMDWTGRTLTPIPTVCAEARPATSRMLNKNVFI